MLEYEELQVENRIVPQMLLHKLSLPEINHILR